MLPPKITKQARLKIAHLVRKLLEKVEDPAIPDNIVALGAWVIGRAAWLLDPQALAESEACRRDIEARRHFGVCVWEPPCDNDAVTDDGLCKHHAAEQRRFEDGVDAELADLEGDPDVH